MPNGQHVVREALHGLTGRGRGLLAAGLAGLAVSLLAGLRALLPVGALLVALPLLAAGAVSLTRYRIRVTRRVQPTRTPVGTPARVSLDVENMSPLPTTKLVVTDTVPATLGLAPRAEIDMIPPHGHHAAHYEVTGLARGRHTLGPVSVGVRDPFGLCLLRRWLPVGSTLVVTPAVEALSGAFDAGRWSSRGEGQARSAATGGEDDVATRPWRPGDDRRRVHWRATARTGTLVVRAEEQSWRAHADRVLDNRRNAHRGHGPDSSLEWAVTATASLASALGGRGVGVRVWTADGLLAADGLDAILDALVDVVASPAPRLTPPVAGVRHVGATGLLIAVLGSADQQLLDELARTPRQHGLALLVDTDSWTSSWTSRTPDRRTRTGPVRTGGPLPAPVAAAALRANGWRTIVARYGDRLTALWHGQGVVT